MFNMFRVLQPPHQFFPDHIHHINVLDEPWFDEVAQVPKFHQIGYPFFDKGRLDSLKPSFQRSLINQIARKICEKHVFSCVPLENEYVRVSRKLIKQCDQLELPLHLAREVRYGVFDTLRKIVIWIRYSTERLGMDLERTLKDITWNAYGRIETEKILRKWLNDEEVIDEKKFSIASELCLGDAIDIYLRMMQTVPFRLYYFKRSLILSGAGEDHNKFDTFNMLGLYAMSQVEGMRLQGDRVLGMHEFQTVNLFFDCLRFGNITGMEFFWPSISAEERKTILPALGEFLVCPARNGFSATFDDLDVQEIEQLVGRVDYSDAICEFYHRILTDEERELVLSKNPPVERMKGYEDMTAYFLTLGEKVRQLAIEIQEQNSRKVLYYE